jgi:hypothetical protein
MIFSFNTLKVIIFSNHLPIFSKSNLRIYRKLKTFSRKMSESQQFLSGSNELLSKAKFRKPISCHPPQKRLKATPDTVY